MRKSIIGLMIAHFSVILVLIGVSLGVTLSGEAGHLLDSISSWIASMATVIIALLTILLAYETQAMRHLQQLQIDGIRADSIRPEPEMFLVQSQSSPQLADLVLRNNGSGIARMVRTEFTQIPNHGLEGKAEKLIEILSAPSFVTNGVSTLGPGREFATYILSFPELTKESQEIYFDVAIEANISCLDVDGNRHENSSVLDLAEFKGMRYSGS